MPQADAGLNDLIEEATALLSASQNNLQTLSTRLSQYLQSAPHSAKNGHQARLAGLQHLHNQTGLLLNQNEALAALLESNFEAGLSVDYPLSRVQLLQRQEEERARTAKNLEDTNAQLLANAIFELAAVKQLITTEKNLQPVIEGLDALQQELEQGLTDLRLLIADLEPNTVLGSFGLVAGLRRYLEKFQENTGIETEFQVQTLIERLPNTVETAIFRIIQETLQNTRRHAGASRVQITVSEEDGNLKFSVLDNGVGLVPNLAIYDQRRLGLVSIKELANLLEGTLHLKSEENKGTQVTLTIPYPKF